MTLHEELEHLRKKCARQEIEIKQLQQSCAHDANCLSMGLTKAIEDLDPEIKEHYRISEYPIDLVADYYSGVRKLF